MKDDASPLCRRGSMSASGKLSHTDTFSGGWLGLLTDSLFMPVEGGFTSTRAGATSRPGARQSASDRELLPERAVVARYCLR